VRPHLIHSRKRPPYRAGVTWVLVGGNLESFSGKGGPMMRRAFIRLIGGLAIACPLACYAQKPKQPLKRVGFLTLSVPCPLQPDDPRVRPVVRGLEELGWIEGQNFVFDCMSSVGRIDQVPALARELVSRRPVC
jgi:hypothetical protein